MPSIKIQQYSFFLGIVCLRLKFAAKVLHFFQIHKKNYEKLLLFSNTTEKKQNNYQISIFWNQNHYCPLKILRRSFKWTVVLLKIKKAHYGVSLNGLRVLRLCLEFLGEERHGAALGADVGRDSDGFLMRLADGLAEDELGYESSGKRISGTDGVSRSVPA